MGQAIELRRSGICGWTPVAALLPIIAWSPTPSPASDSTPGVVQEARAAAIRTGEVEPKHGEPARIPPPRRFHESELRGRATARPKIPPPRRFGTELLPTGASLPATAEEDNRQSAAGLTSALTAEHPRDPAPWDAPAGATATGSFAQPNAPNVAPASDSGIGSGIDATGSGVDATGSGVDAIGSGVDAIGSGVDTTGSGIDAGAIPEAAPELEELVEGIAVVKEASPGTRAGQTGEGPQHQQPASEPASTPPLTLSPLRELPEEAPANLSPPRIEGRMPHSAKGDPQQITDALRTLGLSPTSDRLGEPRTGSVPGELETGSVPGELETGSVPGEPEPGSVLDKLETGSLSPDRAIGESMGGRTVTEGSGSGREQVQEAANEPARVLGSSSASGDSGASAASSARGKARGGDAEREDAQGSAIAADWKATASPRGGDSPASAKADHEVGRTACSSCGGFHRPGGGHLFSSPVGCASGVCIPGQPPCNPPANECDTVLGAFLTNLYQTLCCPDPCYEPRWDPVAYASLFADYARPRTVTRIRVDRGIDMVRPNRNEFFLKQTNSAFPKTVTRNGRTFRVLGDPSLNWSQLYLYQEAAGEKGSLFVEYPYRQINPLFSPTQAGFGDINFGSKAMLFDTELLQVAFQFRTFAPSGNASQGLGTGHFSLDPSILASLKLTDETFFQAQVGQWVPLGGTPQIRGGVLYWFLSLNQVLWWCTPDSPLIGTLEMDGWSFQNGGYTEPSIVASGPPQRDQHGNLFYPPAVPPPPGQHAGVVNSGGGVSYFNIGPGLRWSICNKVDLGTALTWSTTPGQWASPWFRFEVRFLF